MVTISYGDLAQLHMMRLQTASTKTQITRLSQEATTGQTSDAGAHLRGNMGQLGTIDGARARLSAYRTAANELGLFAEAMQTGLSTISDTAEAAAATLLPATGSATTVQVDAAAMQARQGFETIISALNTRFGDRSLFAGKDSADVALLPADDILTALEGALAGVTTAEDAATAVSDWFDSPAGFEAVAYQGGATLNAVPVADGESAALDVTATDPALREIMKGLAMGALLDRGLFAGDPDSRRHLAGAAGQQLTTAQTGLTYTVARLGAAQGQIETAATRNEAELSSLDIARAELLGVDAYDASTRLQNAESQLQLLYTLTARLSNLNLVEYL